LRGEIARIVSFDTSSLDTGETQAIRAMMRAIRFLSTSSARLKTALPPRPGLPDSELHHVYLKGSGPGGQKINKTNSAVQITHLPTGIVVKSQATRSRSQNHKIAKEILAEKIEFLRKGDESRFAKKIEVKGKRKASASKKSKRKYRALEEAKCGSIDADLAEEGQSELDKSGNAIEQNDGKSHGPTKLETTPTIVISGS